MAPVFRRFVAIAIRTWLIASVALLLGSCGGAGAPAVPALNPASPTQVNPVPAPKANLFADLQQKKGWTGSALLPQAYTVCSTCSPGGPQATWSMTQHVSTPS